YGAERLYNAFLKGQHHNPKGVAYHGNEPVWSTLTLYSILDQFLAGAKRICIVDIHTGFGGYGEGIIVTYYGGERHERISTWMREDLHLPGTVPQIPMHDVVYPYSFVENRLPGSEVIMAAIEYGAFKEGEGSWEPYIGSNYFHMHGDPLSEEGRAIGTEMRALFYSDEDVWKKMVWERGNEVIRKFLKGLADWSAE
ncbi:MAG: DUF2817 domain-containing protein, partial [Deltaproteobacteria bacterium]|nr:DUF2817 domain-containing protein [Deltaproteobacteria bacterium]